MASWGADGDCAIFIQGRVIDPASGVGIDGAEVKSLFHLAAWRGETVTDAQGFFRFRLTGGMEKGVTLTVTAPGRETGYTRVSLDQ